MKRAIELEVNRVTDSISALLNDHYCEQIGTTTLFAARYVATGEVVGKFKKAHKVKDFLHFLRIIDETYPEGLIDSYNGPHKLDRGSIIFQVLQKSKKVLAIREAFRVASRNFSLTSRGGQV